MTGFHKVTLDDLSTIKRITFADASQSADYNFGNIYIWDHRYNQLVAYIGDRMVTKLRYDGLPFFSFPVGTGSIKPAIEMLETYAAEEKIPLRILGITEKHKSLLECVYPGKFDYISDPSLSDYIYPAKNLATYAGKSLHGKKNHCNRFEAENDWRFEPITRSRIPDCLNMLDKWLEDNASRLDPSIQDEHYAIIRAFAAYESIGFEGGILYINDRVAGFSFGEMCCNNTFDTHFEKADPSVNGAYPIVCRELARMLLSLHPSLEYINREEDMGIDAIRKSKQSYKPAFLLTKYEARLKNE